MLFKIVIFAVDDFIVVFCVLHTHTHTPLVSPFLSISSFYLSFIHFNVYILSDFRASVCRSDFILWQRKH